VRSGRITGYAEISAEPTLFKTIHAITNSTKSAQEFPSVPSAHESEEVPDTALYQGATCRGPRRMICIRWGGFSRAAKPIK
jgi:hypothetical protein